MRKRIASSLPYELSSLCCMAVRKKVHPSHGFPGFPRVYIRTNCKDSTGKSSCWGEDLFSHPYKSCYQEAAPFRICICIYKILLYWCIHTHNLRYSSNTRPHLEYYSGIYDIERAFFIEGDRLDMCIIITQTALKHTYKTSRFKIEKKVWKLAEYILLQTFFSHEI